MVAVGDMDSTTINTCSLVRILEQHTSR